MRISKNRLYVLAIIPGISGFQRWEEREFHIVTGYKAANNRVDVVGEFTPTADEQFRICDGHLMDSQPIGNVVDVLNFLAANPYQTCIATGRTAVKYCARYCAGKTAAA